MAAHPRVPVIVDVDTGVDDALALLWLARSPAVELLAVSCVAGNAGVDQVVSNTIDVLEAAGRTDVPIGRGAARPLLERPRHATGFHGRDGLGDLLPDRVPRAVDRSAIDLLRAALAATDHPAVVVGLAPLTNIAILLAAYPECAERIARIVFMGGAISDGNATATAEFNAWHDPEALAIVLAAGIPVTMYGLEVFRTARVGAHDRRRLTDAGTRPAALAEQLLGYLEMKGGTDPGLGDAGAAIVAVHPELARSARYPVSVVRSGPARGQTTVDRRPRPGEDSEHGERVEGTVIDVVLEIDPDVVERFVDVVARPARGVRR